MATLSKERQELLAGLKRELESSTTSQHTQSQYISHAIDYLQFVGSREWRNKEVLYLYVAKLKKAGHAQSHINYLIRGAVGSLFRMEGLRLPVRLPRVPPPVYSEAMRFKVSDIEKVIKVAKQGSTQEQVLVAISTTYGTRASELQRIKDDNILRDKKVIIIYTVKNNLKRQHLIPPHISELLLNYHYPPVSMDVLRDMLYGLMARAGVERKPKQSFHAVRHALMEELSYGGMTDSEVYDFIGWVKSGTLGSYVRPLLPKPENDKKAFSILPWLGAWVDK